MWRHVLRLIGRVDFAMQAFVTKIVDCIASCL